MKYVAAWLAIGVLVYGAGELLRIARDKKLGRITLTTRSRMIARGIRGVIFWPIFLVAYIVGAFWAVHRVAMYEPPRPGKKRKRRR